MTSRIDTSPVREVLAREHGAAHGDRARLDSIRPALDAAKANGYAAVADLYPDDVYLAVEPDMGRFLHLTARAARARTIVEFGTSFGISTIYLAAAAAENDGRVITAEKSPAKVKRARANIAEAGLESVVEVREGDALETLSHLPGPVDLLFLDGWKDLYIPVLDLVTPMLSTSALVLADNVHTFPEELGPYVARVSGADSGFETVVLPFESGLAYSLYLRGPNGRCGE